MSARHFNYYEDNWKTAILECPKCHWRGTFEEAGPRYFAEVMDCECPICDFFEAPMLAIVNYSAGDGTDQRPRILRESQPHIESKISETESPETHNLKLHGDVYRYRSAKEGELVEFSVYHDPGGRNDFSGEVEPTGVWIGVIPKEIRDGIVRQRMLEGPVVSGLRFLVIEDREHDRKKLEAVVERFDDLAPEVARMWQSDNERAVQMIADAIDEIQAAKEMAGDGRAHQ